MPTVVSTLSSHRSTPHTKTYTYYTTSSPSSNASSRKSSSPRSTASYTVVSDSKAGLPVGGHFSNYTPTTVSSYRRRSEGLPGPKYFSSGQSKLDRRSEYVQAPTPPSPVPAMSSPRAGRRSSAGSSPVEKQLVKYCGDAYDSDDEREWRLSGEDGDADDELESQTLRPCDSISQVSYPASSSTVSRGRRKRRDSGVGFGAGAGAYSSGSNAAGRGSTFSKISTFESDMVFDETKQYWLVERRPRASARMTVGEVR